MRRSKEAERLLSEENEKMRDAIGRLIYESVHDIDAERWPEISNKDRRVWLRVSDMLFDAEFWENYRAITWLGSPMVEGSSMVESGSVEPRRLPGYPSPSCEIELRVNQIIDAVDKLKLGQFRIHFYKGGLVDVNLNKKPARRRARVGGSNLSGGAA